MGISTRLGCRALLACQGEERWSYYARLHFLCARRHWLLRKRPIAASGIPVDLSTFVSVIIVLVPT